MPWQLCWLKAAARRRASAFVTMNLNGVLSKPMVNTSELSVTTELFVVPARRGHRRLSKMPGPWTN